MMLPTSSSTYTRSSPGGMKLKDTSTPGNSLCKPMITPSAREALGPHIALMDDEMNAAQRRLPIPVLRLGHKGPSSLLADQSSTASKKLKGPVGNGRAHAQHAGRFGCGQVGIPRPELSPSDIEFNLPGKLDDSGDDFVFGSHAPHSTKIFFFTREHFCRIEEFFRAKYDGDHAGLPLRRLARTGELDSTSGHSRSTPSTTGRTS